MEKKFENKNKENKNKFNKIESVLIEIATSEKIESWSSGEVKKPETINYKTHKPEKDGLFDEKIFGPIKDYRCPFCGKKHKRADAGKPCQNCGESIIESKMVRRRKMGHIKLASPIAHIWFSKVDYSVIKSVIGLKQDDLDSIIYFKAHIIYDNGGINEIKEKQIIHVHNAPSIYRDILTKIYKNSNNEEDKKIIKSKIKELVDESSSQIGQNYGIDFYEYNEFISKYSNVKIGTGAETIKTILNTIDLKKEIEKITSEIEKNPNKNVNLRRNKVIESFIKSNQNPGSMVMDVIPVIPADIRPLIQLDGGRHSTVDINELYRRVIIRNNRLKQWLLIGAPNLIVQNEKRMLQESVDALFDNTRKKNSVNSKDNRPLKSLAENLKGKQGRFRQNLLGKRVDYSGRSVIVVGPNLKLHQVGLPKQMVVKLFEPFIVNLLVSEGVTNNIKQAKKMIELFDDKIWKYASRVIKEHPVLLNRAPTLHRLSIQAFEPVITSGKAIRLHPLVTPSFNADFDGDQMAVHVPLSRKAKLEAWELMLSNKNILGPKDGKLILSPSQDIILGIYFLTKINENSIGSKRVYSSIKDIEKLLEFDKIGIHSLVAISLSSYKEKYKKQIDEGYKYLITTVGRIILNEILPKEFIYINDVSYELVRNVDLNYLAKSIDEVEEKFNYAISNLKPFKKSMISELIESVFEFDRDLISEVLDGIKDLGFTYSMISGTSMGWKDIIDIEDREKIIKDGDEKVEDLKNKKDDGLITDDQRYEQVLKVWSNAKEEMQKKLNESITKIPDNSLFMMMDSGARGNISNFIQLSGMRGSMSKATHEYAALRRQGIVIRNTEEIPIKSSFKIGLTPFEYFLSTHGARKGLSDTATKTAESGYLTRRIVDAVQNITIVEEDCSASTGIEITSIIDSRNGTIIESLSDRLFGRYLFEDLKYDGNLIAKKDELITKEKANLISSLGIEKVKIRSILSCNSKHGICKKCYGIDLSTNKEVNIGEAIGIIAAQSIGEPGTQLTMRTFHTGGVAGVLDITQGFSRLMELVDANKNPKSSAVIAKESGVVTNIEQIKDSKTKNKQFEITIESKNDKKSSIINYIVNSSQVLRVKIGSKLEAGDKITEGSIKLQELLEYGGESKTQTYLIKEIQKLYRLQGIEIADKYMEVIIRKMLSKLQIINPGDSNFYTSQIVSEDQIYFENKRLISEGKVPAYGKQIILGVKTLPLYSISFLAAASYQRTAESLVNASILGKIDYLNGIKESLIVGNKIPVGTGIDEPKGKYDIFGEKNYNKDLYVNGKINLENLSKDMKLYEEEVEKLYNN